MNTLLRDVLVSEVCDSDSSNDCGDIVDKYSTLTGKYYFTLVNRAGATTQSGSGGGGEAEVSKDVYDSFSIGDEYCLD